MRSEHIVVILISAHTLIFILHFVCLLEARTITCFIHIFLANPEYLDANFDFQMTTRISVGFRSLET